MNKIINNAVTLATVPAEFVKEEMHVRNFDEFKAIGIEKYFKPETKRQLNDQRIQLKLAKQLKKVKLS